MSNITSNKNITFILFNTKNNGGNRVILEQACRLSEQGYDISVVPLFNTGLSWFNCGLPIQQFYKIIFKKHDTLVATFWPTAFLLLLLYGRKKYYYLQGYEVGFYKTPLLQYLVKLTYRLPFKKIAASKYVRDKVIAQSNKREKIPVVHGYGIDFHMFNHKKRKKSNTSLRILSVVSTYSYPKGIDLLAESVMRIKKRHPDYIFTLVSAEKEPYADVFDYFYSGLSARELANIYKKSDILLATGRSEGFFIPGLEAMACGVLFVTTDSGGIQEYAKNQQNAVVISELSALWENDSIEKLWHNTKLKEKIIVNGLKTAKEYTKPEMLDYILYPKANEYKRIYS